MTPRQLIAFASPCARAFETCDAQFHEVLVFKGSPWSTILTLNK